MYKLFIFIYLFIYNILLLLCSIIYLYILQFILYIIFTHTHTHIHSPNILNKEPAKDDFSDQLILKEIDKSVIFREIERNTKVLNRYFFIFYNID